MASVADRWEDLYRQVPLCDIPRYYHHMRFSPFTMQYLTKILSLCPVGGRTLETGIGSGLSAIWLSLRGIEAEGVDIAPGLVERARQVNNALEGKARFRVGDLFQLYTPDAPHYAVIHHQGVLEHFNAPQIRSALAQQVALAERVVFSVPSVYYPFEPEFGDERLLPLAEWERLLADFDIEELRYYGDPQHGEREHVLCVLRGQEVDDALRSQMFLPEEPFPDGISAIVHTRNEARHIAECLQTLQGWTDEIIVCDMESEDETVEIACRFTQQIVPHPHILNFDRARNVSALRARYRWVFYLDADERVPPGLGPALKRIVTEQGSDLAAIYPPFRHLFAGHWLQCLYPGYTAPRLLKNGKFFFNTRLHSGVAVQGPTARFPADNPDLALTHYSFDSLAHYLDKLNRYTDGEAGNMHRDNHPFHWRNAVHHFVQDFRGYYDQGRAHQDGVHGFIYSFLSAFYRFEQHAKLYELRFRNGQLHPQEQVVPPNVEAILEYALEVAREKPRRQASPLLLSPSPDAAGFVWSGPLHDPSGYGEESRHLVLALDKTGESLAIQSLPWSDAEADISPEAKERLEALSARPVAPGFLHVIHNFALGFGRHSEASVCIGRTIFETDRLPVEWVKACNQMDYLWVATEFNRRTFAEAGVAPEKLVVIPECFDPAPYRERVSSTPFTESLATNERFRFLTVFDWTLHKGWDVLLRAFVEAFSDREDVELLLKVWSTMGYTSESLQAQAATYLQETLGHDLRSDARIRFVTQYLPQQEMIALYQACDALVLPSRGEGWGRPYMEAMACGLPAVGVNWSGNTAFMTPENSYLLDYALTPVPEAGWKEIPTYRGHRWAEPDREQLTALLRHLVENPAEAKTRGERGREEVCAGFSHEAVGPLLAQEIARLRTLQRPALRLVSVPASVETETPPSPTVKPRRNARRAKTESVAQTEDNPTSSLPSTSTLPITARWEGALFSWHSLALVNRELCLGLLESGKMEMSLVPTEPTHFSPQEDPRLPRLAERAFVPLSRPAEVHIRHFFPPRLNPPEEGRLVLIQPWEYGYLPVAWVEPIVSQVEEVWCYSSYVKEVYRASGVPEERLHITPLGVDTQIFHPHAPPYVFTTEPGASALGGEGLSGRFVFLFVGGTLLRKGIDILLEAYLRAFSAYDDVCLVIKDTGTQTVYYKQNERERILGLLGDASRPPMVYLEDDIAPSQLAGLYAACDCLVQPYRGEGFCLPALEAMACGLPVLVPEGGPTDDFVDETVGWRLAAERKPLAAGRVGEWECVAPPWQWEVATDTLARQMRQVYREREEVKRRGEAARERVASGWTWRHACEKALTRLEALATAPKRANASPLISLAAVPTRPYLKLESAAVEEPALASSGVSVRDRRAATQRASRAERKVQGEEKPEGKRRHASLSLCMIVKNEERVLGDCLNSVRPYVDEIIVVDTGSEDRTVEIANQAGAKVFHFPWRDDFSAARNESLKYATGDWIFWMDADDTLPDICGQRLRDLLLQAEERVTGFIMQVHIPPAPGDNGFTVVDHVKLFRNRPELRFVGRIHEQILEPIYKSGGRVERTDLYVVHSGYDYSPEGQQRKRERDLRILELDLQERPDHPFVLFNIGMTAHHLGDFPKAIAALDRCLELSKPHESTVRKVYALLVSCHLETGNLTLAQERLEQGLALTPRDPELLFRAGILYRERGDLAAAERSYVTLLTEREVGHIDSLDVSMTGFKAHHNLALIYQDMGRWDEAEAQWQAALQNHPTFVPSWLGLGELYLRTRRFEDARKVGLKLREMGAPQANDLLERLFAVQFQSGNAG